MVPRITKIVLEGDRDITLVKEKSHDGCHVKTISEKLTLVKVKRHVGCHVNKIADEHAEVAHEAICAINEVQSLQDRRNTAPTASLQTPSPSPPPAPPPLGPHKFLLFPIELTFPAEPPLFFTISVITVLTKILTYPSTLWGHTLYAAARFMTFPKVGTKLLNVIWGKRKGVWEKYAICG